MPNRPPPPPQRNNSAQAAGQAAARTAPPQQSAQPAEDRSYEILPFSGTRPPRIQPPPPQIPTALPANYVPPPARKSTDFSSAANNTATLLDKLGCSQDGKKLKLEDCVVVPVETWDRNNLEWQQRINLERQAQRGKNVEFEKRLYEYFKDEFSDQVTAHIVATQRARDADLEKKYGWKPGELSGLLNKYRALEQELASVTAQLKTVKDEKEIQARVLQNEITSLQYELNKIKEEVIAKDAEIADLRGHIEETNTETSQVKEDADHWKGIAIAQTHLLGNYGNMSRAIMPPPAQKVPDSNARRPQSNQLPATPSHNPNSVVQPATVPDSQKRRPRDSPPQHEPARRRTILVEDQEDEEVGSRARADVSSSRQIEDSTQNSTRCFESEVSQNGDQILREKTELELAEDEKGYLRPVHEDKQTTVSADVLLHNAKSARRVIDLTTDEKAFEKRIAKKGDLKLLYKCLCGGKIESISQDPLKNRLTATFVHPQNAYEFYEYMNYVEEGKRVKKRFHCSVEWNAVARMPMDVTIGQALRSGASRCLRISKIKSGKGLTDIKRKLEECTANRIANIHFITNGVSNKKDGLTLHVEFFDLSTAIRCKTGFDNKEWAYFQNGNDYSRAAYTDDPYWKNEFGKFMTPSAKHES